MQAHRKAGAFARRHKKHLIAAHTLALAGVLAAFLAGVFATGAVIYGTHLTDRGVNLYHRIADRKVERGMGSETLPAPQAAKVKQAAEKAEAQLNRYPHPAATPEPVTKTELLARNYSSRSSGARPLLLVVHDTESPNAPGLADVEAIRAWFNNPAAQASSNFTTDADGNTLELVPDTKKAWTQVTFNSWAISDELIGHATQTTWPAEQLNAVAAVFAHEAAKWGIPIQPAEVSGCTILRPGILMHKNLGLCGGGHHDNGDHFPMARFIQLVKAHAAPAGKPKPAVKRTPTATLRARTGFYSWLGWYLGEGAWKPYGRRNRQVRPHAPVPVPGGWWKRERRFVAARH